MSKRLTSKRNIRCILAAAFLFVLIAEWGSHALICSDHFSYDAQSISARDTSHEDPCQTLVLCSDGKQKDQLVPKLGHDASQHNVLFDPFARLRQLVLTDLTVKIPLSWGDALFRPPDTPFHPPKLA